MASTSTTRKLGIAARIFGEQVRQTRAFGAVMNGAKTMLSHFGIALRQLWLEVTGFVFLAFAGIGVVFLFREYSAYHAGRGTSGRIAEAAGFALVFGWFGVSSFWKARRKT
jgi:hypothetical protein